MRRWDAACIVERQKLLPLLYDNLKVACAYRMDLVVEEPVVIEVKSVTRIDCMHEAQMIEHERKI